jgi:hypothetical protein
MSDNTEALIDDIKAAVNELADGRKFPCLLEAIDRLAALAEQGDILAEVIRYRYAIREKCIASLQARLDAAERDAARYRWLRSIGEEQGNVFGHYAGRALDEKIDAATQEQPT